MWSYAQANRWYSAKSATVTSENAKQNRKRKRRFSMPTATGDNDQQVEMMYPNNLTTANLYYFILAPTLCYEMEYPRTEKVRPYFLFKRLFETLFLFWLMIALIQQWLMPHMDRAAIDGSGTVFHLILFFLVLLHDKESSKTELKKVLRSFSIIFLPCPCLTTSSGSALSF